MDKEAPSNSSSDPHSDPPSECPACGSSAISILVPSIGPVCEDCGAATANASEVSLESPARPGEETETAESWTEYHSVTNSTEERIADSLDVLEAIGDHLALENDTRKQAAEVYAEAAIENLTDGRATELTVGATVVYATRIAGNPRPHNCIAEAADIDRDSLRRTVRLLGQELDRTVPFSPPEEYLPYLSDELQLDAAVVASAKRMLGSIDGAVLAGKNPVGFAGAVLYLAANGSVTQREIAGATGVTKETLRVRVRDCRAAEVAL